MRLASSVYFLFIYQSPSQTPQHHLVGIRPEKEEKVRGPSSGLRCGTSGVEVEQFSFRYRDHGEEIVLSCEIRWLTVIWYLHHPLVKVVGDDNAEGEDAHVKLWVDLCVLFLLTRVLL